MTYRQTGETNEAMPLLSEFISRKRLAQLGYTSPISELPNWKAQMFCLIDTEIEKWQNEDNKKKQ